MTDQQGADESIVAHQWLTDRFEPVVGSVPQDLRGKLEPAEVFHEVLEHRWFASERAGREVPLDEAAQSYVHTVLGSRPDEKIALSSMASMGPLANPYDPSQGFDDDEESAPYDPWEDDESASEDDAAGVPEGFLDIAALRARAGKG
jgi:hypothetical protein